MLRLLGSIVAALLLLAPAQAAPRVENGVIDLRGHDFSANPVIALSGDWLFYHRRLLAPGSSFAAPDGILSVPRDWNGQVVAQGPLAGHDFGSYVVTVLLPPGGKRPHLAFDTDEPLSAWRLYVNGVFAAESGTIGTSPESEKPRSLGAVVELPDYSDKLQIVLQVSNFSNRDGGLWRAPRIGTADVLAAKPYRNAGLALAFIGALLVMGAYHLTFMIRQTDGFAQAAFGLFSILVGLRSVFSERIWAFVWPEADQIWMWRIEYLLTFSILPAAFAFLAFSFPREVRWRWWGYAVIAVCSAACISALVLPMTLAASVMNAFQLFAGASILVFLAQLVAAVRRKRPGAGLSLLGWSCGGAAAITDMLYYNGLSPVGGLLPVGFLLFLLTQSGMLGMRFRLAVQSAHDLSVRLRALNRSLEAEVQRRTADLSEKVRLLTEREAELDHARQASDAANQAKSRFLATMSHELRTPLNAVLGFSELIGQQAFGPVGDKRYVEYAQLIHSGGAHLLALINDILDLSKVEAGRRDLECEPVGVADLIATARALTAGRAEERGVKLAFQRDAALTLYADRRACLQMLVNLLANAIKFTEQGGKVSLTTSRRPDGGADLIVSDTGIGMDPQDIPKALEAFSQLDSGHARRHEGTGLGLAIVQALIRLHGGAIGIESVKGQGTTVTLSFPPDRVREREASAA